MCTYICTQTRCTCTSFSASALAVCTPPSFGAERRWQHIAESVIPSTGGDREALRRCSDVGSVHWCPALQPSPPSAQVKGVTWASWCIHNICLCCRFTCARFTSALTCDAGAAHAAPNCLSGEEEEEGGGEICKSFFKQILSVCFACRHSWKTASHALKDTLYSKI